MKKIKEHSLYFLITEEYCRRRDCIEVARRSIDGGADMIQLREKNGPGSDVAGRARELCALCRQKGVTFIVNDDPILAKEVDADGVHLGQEDLKLFTVAETRQILGKNKIIGLSTGSVDDVERANGEDVDYIGFGPVFPTTVKDKCVGTKAVELVLKTANKPVFFIGGIGVDNVDELLAKGAKNIAVIRAISEADDIKRAAKELKTKIGR